jgi:undecaprenyl-diphosphatase
VPYWKRLALGTFAGASCLFALIAANLAAGDPLVRFDGQITLWLHAHGTPALTLLMLAVTHTHGPLPICLYAFVTAIVLVRKREWPWLTGLALAVPTGLLINMLLKHLFHRARPALDEPLVTLATYSFPSGHTAGSTLFYGFLAAYIGYRMRDKRVRAACVTVWLFMAALVGFSRVYLGVHYFSDVLAAFAWSLAWLALSLTVVHSLQSRALATGK